MCLFVGITILECDKCGKCYNKMSSLHVHKSIYCGKEASFKCPQCSYKTHLTANLRRHAMLRHALVIKQSKAKVSKDSE